MGELAQDERLIPVLLEKFLDLGHGGVHLTLHVRRPGVAAVP